VRKRVLIVSAPIGTDRHRSAPIGAGHDGAAHELADRLRGHRVEHIDFLDLLPGRLGTRLCDAYHRQLQWAPRSWDWLLGALGSPALAALTVRASALACRSLLAVAGEDTDLIISTYPLASHATAHLRARGHLASPFAVYLTDPSVHRLCVSPAADLHIAPNATAATQARRFGAPWVEIASPLVGPAFRPVASGAEKAQARRSLGLPPHQRLALVVSGSWGVGDVERITHDVAHSGSAQPVVVCGRNSALLHRLRQAGHPHVFGWIDDMPELIRACDVVVQNAGGLTTSEALACGLPVITYRCLPGHGRSNAWVLDQEGMVPWIRRSEDLPAALAAPVRPRHAVDRDATFLLAQLLGTTTVAA
jgi:UDP-N-acetylglucosamine:LPS N-acetylglucosamine transferase